MVIRCISRSILALFLSMFLYGCGSQPTTTNTELLEAIAAGDWEFVASYIEQNELLEEPVHRFLHDRAYIAINKSMHYDGSMFDSGTEIMRNSDRVHEWASSALKHYPDNPNFLFLAALAMTTGSEFNIEEKFHLLTKAIHHDSSFMLAYLERGLAYHFNMQSNLAEADFKMATELNEDNCYFYLIRSMFDVDDHAQALEDIELCLSNYPKNIAALSSKALILQRLGRNTEAVDALQLAVEFQPESLELGLLLAEGLEEDKRLTEALSLYKRISNRAANSSPKLALRCDGSIKIIEDRIAGD